jgi:hypothetical protein
MGLISSIRRRVFESGNRRDREAQLSRIRNWVSVHGISGKIPEEGRLDYEQTYLNSPATTAGSARPFFIFSTGHSGSVWAAYLCQLMNPDRMICLHAHETVLTWPDPVAGLRGHYERYSQWFNIVGYSLTGMSGAQFAIFEAAAAFNESVRLIHLVRNGILSVNSMYRFHFGTEDTLVERPAIPKNSGEWLAGDSLIGHRCEELFAIRHKFPAYAQFAGICYNWGVTNLAAHQRLRSSPHMLPVQLENLVSSQKAAVELYEFVTDSTVSAVTRTGIALAQAVNVNKKLKDNHDPSAVWGQWDETQRIVFRLFCDEAMETFGY